MLPFLALLFGVAFSQDPPKGDNSTKCMVGTIEGPGSSTTDLKLQDCEENPSCCSTTVDGTSTVYNCFTLDMEQEHNEKLDSCDSTTQDKQVVQKGTMTITICKYNPEKKHVCNDPTAGPKIEKPVPLPPLAASSNRISYLLLGVVAVFKMLV